MKPWTTAITALLLLLTGGVVAGTLVFLWASSGRYGPADYAQVNATDHLPLKAATDEFTVVSYNIGYLSGLTNNRAVSRTAKLYSNNLAIATAALQSVNPDILALQEIDIDSRRSFRVNQVEALATTLAYPQQAIAINWDKRYVPFPYWPPSAHFGEILSGQAILSRFAIKAHQRIVLEKVPGHPFYYNALYLERLAQVAEIQLGARSLILINLHLEAFDTPTRQRQTEFVLAMAEQYAERYPVLLLGDFNSALNREAEGPHSIQTVLDSPVFRPAVSTAELTQPIHYTFPSDQPQFKLDYVFYTPANINLLDVQVLTAAGQASDHLPVLTRFRLR